MLWQVSPALRPMFRRCPQFIFGAFGSTVKDVTAAYSAFAAGGVRREPYLIERIDDQDGTIIYQHIRSSDRSLAGGLPGW